MPVPKLNKDDLLKSEHQLGMVLDLNKCIGCQTCTVACKTLWTDQPGQTTMYWNNVETRPGSGYPRGMDDPNGGWTPDGSQGVAGRLPARDDYGTSYEFDYQQALFSPGQTPLAPKPEPDWGVNWDEDKGQGAYPNAYLFYLPRLCNHCSHPACVEACPRNALYKRSKDGIVLLNQERCHGYRFCVEACPYKKIYWNHVAKVSQKCIFCYPRIDQGITTACSAQCVGQVRFVGLVDDEASPLYQLVHTWKVALPLLPQHGTEPNVFYVPPTAPEAVDAKGRPTGKRRVPMDYLESLFGKGVAAALATLESELGLVRRGQSSKLMSLLNVIEYRDLFTLPTQPTNGAWFGAFSAAGSHPSVASQKTEN